MLFFDRRAERITKKDEHGALVLVSSGIYAGFGDAANDPSREQDKGVGPLPAGVYEFGKPETHPHLGPFAMALRQIEGESYGRSGFYIHGDNTTPAPHDASHGCIIAPRRIREAIDKETDRRITVI